MKESHDDHDTRLEDTTTRTTRRSLPNRGRFDRHWALRDGWNQRPGALDRSAKPSRSGIPFGDPALVRGAMERLRGDSTDRLPAGATAIRPSAAAAPVPGTGGRHPGRDQPALRAAYRYHADRGDRTAGRDLPRSRQPGAVLTARSGQPTVVGAEPRHRRAAGAQRLALDPARPGRRVRVRSILV